MIGTPGIKAIHAIITPTCRANRGVEEAIDTALHRLREEYLACQHEANDGAQYHVVLTVERPPEPHRPFICGEGYTQISPEAQAELRQFAEFLKEKKRRQREGLPRITFDDWRAALAALLEEG